MAGGRGAARRDACLGAGRPDDQRALVPALVTGDDGGLDPALADDFRTTGLTHLLAVSGTNLTLVVGFLLVVARWFGVRGRWPYAVGGPRHRRLRAAGPHRAERGARGGHGRASRLLGLGSNGRQPRAAAPSASPSWCCCCPTRGWPVSLGFALSVLATGGILLLAPGWRDALARWLPRWAAEAVAVPAAAQLACTPLVAAISGQVSLVAVVANLLVGPVVGPATVLGLAGGLARPALAAAGPPASVRRGLVRRLDRRWSPGAAPGCPPPPSTGAPAGAPWPCSPPCCIGRSRWPAPRCSRGAPPASPAACCSWLGGPGAAADARAGRRTAGCSPPATSARATRWSSDAGPGPALVVDAGPDPAAVDALPATGSTWTRCRCWCSPTSTPTTSTGWRGSWTAAGRGGRGRPRLRDPPAGAALVDARGRCGAAGPRAGVRRDPDGRAT